MSLGRVAIVGAGQIGTAIGMRLRQTAPDGVTEVALFDRDPSVTERSLERDAGSRALSAPGEALEADTIVLALPVTEICAFLSRYGPAMRPSSMVVDTGSAKRAVVDAMAASLPSSVGAVGGHPMVGTERPGPEGAEPDLFPGSTFVLTPVRDDPDALARASDLVRALGARPLVMDAREHDATVAVTSHLPHLMAYGLSSVAAEASARGRPVESLAASGYREATRLAASDPEMVAAFLSANADQVRMALGELGAALEDLGRALPSGPHALARVLAAGRRTQGSAA